VDVEGCMWDWGGIVVDIGGRDDGVVDEIVEV